MKTLLDQIETRRVALDLSQDAAAKLARISQPHWSRICTTGDAKLSTAVRMARAVGLQLSLRKTTK